MILKPHHILEEAFINSHPTQILIELLVEILHILESEASVFQKIDRKYEILHQTHRNL